MSINIIYDKETVMEDITLDMDIVRNPGQADQ